MTSFYMYDIDDPDMQDMASFEAEAPPPIDSLITVANGPETPTRYRVCRYTYRVQGDQLRGVSIGCELVLS